MRWKIHNPARGEQRILQHTAWLPRRLDGYWIWLENFYELQHFCGYAGWMEVDTRLDWMDFDGLWVKRGGDFIRKDLL